MSCDLENMPLRRGSVFVVGGEMSFTVAKRLAQYARTKHPRLRVVMHTPAAPINPNVMTIISPSYNRTQNAWLQRDEVTGIITSEDGENLKYTNARTGKTTKHQLPPLAREASVLLQQLGY
jgi:hypothetical protein